MKSCWFHRAAIARDLARDAGFRPAVSRHLIRCEKCRSFAARHQRLESRLREAPAATDALEPSPFLHGRIMAAIHRSDRQQANGPDRVRRGAPATPAWLTGLASIAVVAVVAVVSIVVVNRDSPEDTGPRATRAEATSVLNLARELNGVVNAPDRDLGKWAVEFDRPLEREWNAVVADAKSAAALLAHNFLPSSPDQDLGISPGEMR